MNKQVSLIQAQQAVLFGILFIGGCAHSPSQEYGTTISAPEQWETAIDVSDDEAVDQPWIESWHSEDLQNILEQALKHNYDLQLASTRLETALARSGIVRASGIPTLSTYASAGRQKINTGEIPITNTSTNFSIGLTLNWEVDLWGKIKDRRQAAIADAEEATYTFQAARLSLLATVARSWFNWIETSRQADLAEASAKSFSRNAQRAKDQYEQGVGEALDFQLLQAQAESARANLQNRLIQKDEAGRELQILLGKYPKAIKGNTLTFPDFPAPLPPGVPSDILIYRPDILAAERNLSAAEKRYGASRKERLPSFSLTASAGTSSRELNDLVNENFSVWSLIGNLSAPIFQAGRIKNSIREAKALYEISRLNYEKTILSGYKEVEQALANEAHLLMRQAALAKAAESSRTAEDIAWQRYQRGLVDIVTVLEAQRRSFEAKSAEIQATNRLHQNRLSLLLALGSDPFTTNN